MTIYLEAQLENGTTICTKINATIEQAVDYYLGRYFDIGTEEENMQRCVKVFIENMVFTKKEANQ